MFLWFFLGALLTVILVPILVPLVLPVRAVFPGTFHHALFYFENRATPITITIDDGPSEFSHIIEAVLEKHHVHAHWFAIGERAQRHPDVISRWKKQNYSIQNHDIRDRISVMRPVNMLIQDIRHTDNLLQCETKFFRPGCGVFTKGLSEAVKASGKQLMLGDVYAHDPFWSYFPRSISVPVLVWHAKRFLQHGSILVLHDGNERRCRQTAEVLDRVLSELPSSLSGSSPRGS